jgi:hypothetical protein
MLLPGKYSAEISAKRNGVNIPGKKTAKFIVDDKIDKEFYVENLEIREENVHEEILEDLPSFIAYILNFAERADTKFIAANYVDFQRTGGKTYIAYGNINYAENSLVYITYQSVTFGSAVISDAGQKGSFKVKVPKGVPAGSHKMTAYAYDPKTAKSSSMKNLSFRK